LTALIGGFSVYSYTDMVMKRSILPLSILLPVLCAATAAAQFAPVRFVAPVNPVAGLPRLLPSPLTGPLVGNSISLPNLVPSLTPSLSLAAIAAAPAYLPAARMPSREGQLPAAPAKRDEVVNPLRRVQPGVVIRFSGAVASSKSSAAAQPDDAKPELSKENLDQAFDGEGRPKPVVDGSRRKPVTSGRHISLPEWDLEKELGI
jgi:hypothetical protein